VALEVVQPAGREIPLRHQHLGIITDERGNRRLVRRLPLEVPLVSQLQGPVAFEHQPRRRTVVRLEQQRLVFALRQIAVPNPIYMMPLFFFEVGGGLWLLFNGLRLNARTS